MSRWDALRTDFSAGGVHSSSSYSRRRRLPTGNSNFKTSRQDKSNFHGNGRVRNHVTSSVRSDDRVTDNSELRSRHHHKHSQTASCSRVNNSKSEDIIKDVLEKFKYSVSSFIESWDNEDNLRATLKVITKTLFQQIINPDSILDGFVQHEQIFSCSMDTSLSPDLVSEIVYIILRGIKEISNKNGSLQNECKKIIINLTNLASVCLGIFISHQQDYDSIFQTRTERPKYFTDLRLCDYATVLLDIVNSCTDDTTTQCVEVMEFKASIFACLAKIMMVSSINWGNDKNRQTLRSPLFPWGAERTATFIVKQSILPFVKSVENSTVSTALKLAYCQAAMECLYVLLNDHDVYLVPVIKGGKIVQRNHLLSKHAAAILAPLVVDVLPDGKENLSRNPLRSDTIAAISAFWSWSCQVANGEGFSNSTTNGWITTSCRSMTAVINALYALKKGKYPCTKQSDCSPSCQELNASEIATQIYTILLLQSAASFQSYFLELLTSLSLMYPSTTARHWHLFLEATGPRNHIGDKPAVGKASCLILFVNRCVSEAKNEAYDDGCWLNMLHALRAISALISSMPLSLWISSEGRTSYRLSAGNFPTRVRQTLINAMSVLLNLMCSFRTILETKPLTCSLWSKVCLEQTMMQCSILAGQFCTMLPFAGDNHVLIEPASNILCLAADIYILGLKMVEVDNISPMATSQVLGKASSIFGHVILESLGYGVTDSGKAVAVSPPARRWLQNVSSYEFIGIILTKSTYRNTSQLKERAEMMSSVAKSAPWVITREPFNLATFRDTCSHLCGNTDDAKTRLLGVKLIQSFLLGRKAFQAQCELQIESPVVQEYFCPLLQSALKDESPSVRISAISSFGALLQSDWRSILLSPDESMLGPDAVDWTCVSSILQASSDRFNTGIRIAACKTIGDIYSECTDTPNVENEKNMVPFCDAFAVEFSDKVCKKMELAITDVDASVRSMTIFAIGNVAFTMRGRSENSKIYIPTIKDLFDPVNACLDDRDEKVVGNAIRTIGHIAYFVYSPMYLESVLSDNAHILKSYTLLLSSLTSKVELAICDALGESSRDLSWKQRNSTKKHAWGACTSIGTLLSFSNIAPLIQYSIIEVTLNELFRCIQLHKFLHEKITAASSASLIKVPHSLWRHCSSKCGSLGRGLATCFGFLDESVEKSRSHPEVENLTKVMLSAANSEDFCIMFSSQDDIPFDVEHMYRWLVSNDLDVHIFDKISLALENQRILNLLDVSVGQMFLTRTRHKHKSPCKHVDTLLGHDSNGDESDEDGDEL